MATRRSLDDLLQGVPRDKQDQQCTNEHVCMISLAIGTDWIPIATLLHVPDAVIEGIEDKRRIRDRSHGMLKVWKKQAASKATYRKLAKVFWKLQRHDLVEEVRKVLVDDSSSSDEDSPTPEVALHRDVLEQYTDHLRLRYLMEIPTFSQWPPPPTRKVFNLAMIHRTPVQRRPIDEDFIRQTQRGNVDDIMESKTAIELKDIFKTGSKRILRKIILIEGAPGAGKSTLAWHICQNWGSRDLFGGEFKLVVFVQLRDPVVQSAPSIADVLPGMSNGRQRECLSKLECRYGRSVLFVLDGWDEYRGGLTRDSIFRKLIRQPGDLNMQGSTLLITSRPVASGELQQYCSTRIEIVGFRPAELKEYFKDALREAHEEHQEVVLQECLRVRPVIQASCYLPLNAAIVVHLFLAEGNTLPTTLHSLFTSLVINCIVRHLTKGEEEGKLPRVTSLDDIPEEIQPHFKAICALAFDAIQNNKASFSEEELHSFKVTNASLLSLIQGWCTFRSNWKERSYSFFHLSVQELLAAYYIQTRLPSEQVQIFRELFGQPRFAAVLQFYAAFTKFKVEGIRDFMKETIGRQRQVTTVNEAILNCLYEAQDPSLCQYVAVVMKKKLEVTHTLSPLYCMVIGYFLHCISLTPGGGKFHIDFGDNDLDEYRCGYLVNELKKCECGQLSLSLSGKDRWAETASLLVPMLQRNCSHCISELSLSIIDCSGSGFGQLAQSLLADSGPLIFLNFRSLTADFRNTADLPFTIPPEGVRALADFLAYNSTLQELNLLTYTISSDGMRALADSLTKNSTLQTLNLSWCRIPPEGIRALADSLTKNSTLQTLNLSCCTLPPEGISTLADSLTKNSTLQILDLSWCTIPPDGIRVLADIPNYHLYMSGTGTIKLENAMHHKV